MRMCAFGYLLFFALLLTTILVLSIIFATSSKRSMMDSFILVFNYTQKAKEQQQDDELLQDEQQQQHEELQQQQNQMLFKPKLFWFFVDVSLCFTTHLSIGKCFKNMSTNILQNFINSQKETFQNSNANTISLLYCGAVRHVVVLLWLRALQVAQPLNSKSMPQDTHTQAVWLNLSISFGWVVLTFINKFPCCLRHGQKTLHLTKFYTAAMYIFFEAIVI